MRKRFSRLSPPVSRRNLINGGQRGSNETPPSVASPPFSSPYRPRSRPSPSPSPSHRPPPPVVRQRDPTPGGGGGDESDEDCSVRSSSSVATGLSVFSVSALPDTMHSSYIQVCIRVRPLLVGNRATQHASVASMGKCAWDHDGTTIKDTDKLQNAMGNRRSTYTFDAVYSALSGTKEIYEKEVRPVVRASMEGYHGSVLCYGQTGTGKTYTMQGIGVGPAGEPAVPGLLPLSVDDCFRFVQERQDSCDREYLFRVTYLEIYNEALRDLLSPGVTATRGRSGRAMHPNAPPAQQPIRLMENRKGVTILQGAREVVVTSPAQAYALIASGEAHRATGSTGMNARSSRSHTVFRLIIESRGAGRSAGSDAGVRISTLSLVDLAGSESSKAAGTTGQRLKEGHHINQSLGTLGRVIFRLSEANEKKKNLDVRHVPYRDSKLTRILQPSLGGNARVALVSTVSVAEGHVDETHNTLKFAGRAKNVRQKAVVTEVKDERAMLQRYREEIERLRGELEQMKAAGAQTKAKAAEAQAKEADGAPPSRASGEDADADADTDSGEADDEGELKEAIRNLENVILKSKVAVISTEAAPATPISSTKTDKDDAEVIRPSASAEDDPRSFFNTPQLEKAPSTPGAEGRGPSLVEELGRVKKALANVLRMRSSAKKASPKKKNGAKAAAAAKKLQGIGGGGQSREADTTPSFARDLELECLQEKLRDQELESNVRDADRGFLEKQLQEKDRLMKDVGEVLGAAETRQRQLEFENSRLKMKIGQLESEIVRLRIENKKHVNGSKNTSRFNECAFNFGDDQDNELLVDL